MEYKLKEVDKFVWELPKQGAMRVPARVYGDKQMIDGLVEDLKQDWNALKQLANVATLPGIQDYALAMSDVHPGYGFPIGGVGAFDTKEGVITFAGVGFDINCGVRTMTTPLTVKDVQGKKRELADALFRHVPAGLGSTGDLRLNPSEIDEVLVKGAEYALEHGYGNKRDLEFTEEGGRVSGADPHAVSDKAKQRQFKQVGTLGSGNHYIEVQAVDEVYDEEAAEAYGLQKDQVIVSFHCGSRALGHQIGTDYLTFLDKATHKYSLPVLDRELVAAPFQSDEGQQYFSAVKAGSNCAFANRQVLCHLVRGVFTKVFGLAESDVKTLYDVGHNTCKLERHDGKELLVHRKGATRAFGPGCEEVPQAYRKVGQPVLIGGTMGTCSYILKGTDKGMRDTFGSACHGAGRAKSRTKAKREVRGDEIAKELIARGIEVRGHSAAGLAEEAPDAYKDVNEVVAVMHATGISSKVVRAVPLAVVKG